MAIDKCKKCGNEVRYGAAARPKCAGKVKSLSMIYGTIVLGVFILAMFIGVSSGTKSKVSVGTPVSGAPSEVFHPGDDVLLVVSEGVVLLADNEQAYGAFMKLAIAKDYLGMAQMEASGSLFSVPSGTKARIIDRGFERRLVRIMEGKHFGRSGWVVLSLLKKP
ncbi:hypothetical protein [Candidatus Macondimonas diazotrophica]|jgi:hypothetical protein|uniref:Uncharacterized protein n=1 Tax=Candidatus Macondimonas diazotrophica TaxID=2305248 RepID=A0A4Z0F917_9GAMM|nr:hypothetical protein [Candidatus Macondimonas diazotrophica]TFZ82127.1 hypothetical protein E4680_09835 [Candidatus Macondimonas diazotrophica]